MINLCEQLPPWQPSRPPSKLTKSDRCYVPSTRMSGSSFRGMVFASVCTLASLYWQNPPRLGLWTLASCKNAYVRVSQVLIVTSHSGLLPTSSSNPSHLQRSHPLDPFTFALSISLFVTNEARSVRQRFSIGKQAPFQPPTQASAGGQRSGPTSDLKLERMGPRRRAVQLCT